MKANIGLANEVATSILQKYGEPSQRSDLAMLWSYDINDKLLKTGVGCLETKLAVDYAKPGDILCGLNITAQVEGNPGQPTNGFIVEMRNWKLSRDDALQMELALKAKEDNVNRSLQGVRPKL